MELFDYIIIGSGFGGSVSAMRLAEKGYRVLVLEQGKDFKDKDFPKTNWNFKRYLWIPLLHCFGIQKISFFKNVLVLSGTGVGGGSLVYANTHIKPKDSFFTNKQWRHLNDWKSLLEPHYQTAKMMLGSVVAPNHYLEDTILKSVAEDMNKLDSFNSVEVGVYFGNQKQNDNDPYFNGYGPKRDACQLCAGCMVGCRYNAKNTLTKNYLYFAKYYGCEILSQRKVEKIELENDTYSITTFSMKCYPLKLKKKVFQAKHVIVSAGVLGTLDLLFKQKYLYKTMPNLSSKLGYYVRTNSESLLGVSAKSDIKLNHGVAISSVFEPDEDTHIEIVKYPNRSSLMKMLAGPAIDEKEPKKRSFYFFKLIFRHPVNFIKSFLGKNWANRSIILLVMQSLDNSMKLTFKRFPFKRLSFDKHYHDDVPSYIESGQKVMHRYAKKINAQALNAMTETVFNMSTTAHILGGVPMAKSINDGVINSRFEVHGYPNLLILDGSVIQGNLGVNPSLTITAISEYAISLIPEKPRNRNTPLEELMSQ
ncbi:GMC oxidoreductase [Thiotrichales bacterium 19S3-7]|nr:GMC oxidoreductase [Thiotrichales bacterium 19S3-7]MCF6802755.1 GMC oxidoreductase [Thiotrichales bacterium 19S3-11]